MNSVAAQPAMKRDRYQVSMAATFAVASEFSRRGYNVGLTVGNTPKIDLICSVPDGKPFKVQVKGLSREAGVFIRSQFFNAPAQKNLFLIIVLVPPVPEPCRFFVLTHAHAIEEWKKDGAPYSSTDGLPWKDIKPHEGNWEVLPKLS